MKRFIPMLLAAVLMLPSKASAIDPLPLTFCGGSYSGFAGFGFCASVDIGLAQNANGTYKVTLTVANLSGMNGSYAGSLLTQFGLDNLLTNVANPVNLVVAQNGTVVCTNQYNLKRGDAKGCWWVNEDAQGANGAGKIDILTETVNGVNRSLSSDCPSGFSDTRIYTCLSSAPVTISFDVTGSFSTDVVELYVKAQAGPYNDLSTSCHTSTGSNLCVPVTTVPEPGTLLLIGTGAASLLPAIRRRRKTKNMP